MEYKSFPIKDILEFQPKSRHKAGEGLDVGKYPFFTSSQNQRKWFTVAEYTTDAVILGTGGMPSVHFSAEFSTSTDVFILAPKNKNISAKYISLYLTANKELLKKGFKGAGLKHLSKEYVEKLTIRLPVDKNGSPDRTEQDRIVKILEEAEQIKEKREEANRKMETLVPALFDKMFRGVTGKENKFPVLEIKSVCKFITDGTHQPPKFATEGIPFLFVKNIVSGEINFDTEKFISEETYQELTKKYRAQKGDILYSTVGSYGVAVQIKEDRKFSFQRHIGHLSPDPTKVNDTFLCAQLNTPFVKKQADLRARGVAQKTLNLLEIKKFTVVIPPIDLQNKFAETVKEIEAQKEKQREVTKKTDELFASLLGKYFPVSV